MPRRQEHQQFALNYAQRMLTNKKVKLSTVELRRWFDRYCVLAGLVKIEIKDEQPQGRDKDSAPSLDDLAQEMLKRLGGENNVNTSSTTSTSAESATD